MILVSRGWQGLTETIATTSAMDERKWELGFEKSELTGDTRFPAALHNLRVLEA